MIQTSTIPPTIFENTNLTIIENISLTPLEKLTFLALREYTDENGTLLVTLVELAHLIGISPRAVQRAISKLVSQDILSTNRNSNHHIDSIEFHQ